VSSELNLSVVNVNGNPSKCQGECSLEAAGEQIKGTIDITVTSTKVEACTRGTLLEILTFIAVRKSYRLHLLLATIPQIFLDAVFMFAPCINDN